jgi:hypothetical protein
MRILMRRLLFFAAVCAITSLVFAASASAATHQTVTETDHMRGSWVEPGNVNPCTGDTFDLNVTGNSVNHVTYFVEDGQMTEVWGTFTEAVSFWFTDQGVTYAGHSTVWGNFNLNERNSNQTFTFSVHATGSDGSTITGHETMHETLNANGQVTVSFDKMSFTCS